MIIGCECVADRVGRYVDRSYINIVEVINAAPMGWAADKLVRCQRFGGCGGMWRDVDDGPMQCGIPFKTKENPKGLYTALEVHDMFKVLVSALCIPRGAHCRLTGVSSCSTGMSHGAVLSLGERTDVSCLFTASCSSASMTPSTSSRCAIRRMRSPRRSRPCSRTRSRRSGLPISRVLHSLSISVQQAQRVHCRTPSETCARSWRMRFGAARGGRAVGSSGGWRSPGCRRPSCSRRCSGIQCVRQ